MGAASTAYMVGKRLTTIAKPFLPSEQQAWQKTKKEEGDDKVVRLRVKCCKLIEGPELEQLAIELVMIARWLGLMVALDEGFDLDIEALVDASVVSLVEEVLRGERAVEDLPSVCT